MKLSFAFFHMMPKKRVGRFFCGFFAFSYWNSLSVCV